jgi:hypothetical protein
VREAAGRITRRNVAEDSSVIILVIIAGMIWLVWWAQKTSDLLREEEMDLLSEELAKREE